MLERVAIAYAEDAREVARIERYWDGFDKLTKRKNGDVVGNPRDVVDTGAFDDGIKPEDNRVYFKSPHSAAVIYGHRTPNGFVPGRDVIGVALDRFKANDTFQKIVDETEF